LFFITAATLINPVSCGISTSGFTQAQIEAAIQTGIRTCKYDPVFCGITATYNPSNGEVHIPFIGVPNGIGFTQTFDVYLLQRNGSFTFDLDLSRVALVH